MTDDLELGTYRLKGKVLPDGCGQAVESSVHIGDGAPPTILIRLGGDSEGSIVVDLSVGGFPDSGSLDSNLKDVGAFLGLVSEILLEDEPEESSSE